MWKSVIINGDYLAGNYGSSGSRQWKCSFCKENKCRSIARVWYHLLVVGKKEQIIVCKQITKEKRVDFIQEFNYVDSFKPVGEKPKDSQVGMPQPLGGSSTSIFESQIGKMFDATVERM